MRTSRLIYWMVTAALGNSCGPSHGQGQELTVIPEHSSCEACSVVFRQIRRLSPPADGPGLVVRSMPAITSGGRIWIAPTDDRERILFFEPDAEGAQVLELPDSGRPASEIDRIYSEGDTLHLFAGPEWILISDSGEFLGRSLLPTYPRDFLALSPDIWVGQFHDGSPDRAGYPLHRISPRLGVRLSFGARMPFLTPANPEERFRGLASGGRGDVWTGRYDRLEVENWDAGTGEFLGGFESHPSYFTPRISVGPLETTARDLRVDEEGRVWVLVNVPKSTLDLKAPPPTSEWLDPRVWESRWTTVVEIYDPRVGRKVTQGRYPGLFERFVGPYLYSMTVAEDDRLVIDLWGVSLRKPDRSDHPGKEIGR